MSPISSDVAIAIAIAQCDRPLVLNQESVTNLEQQGKIASSMHRKLVVGLLLFTTSTVRD